MGWQLNPKLVTYLRNAKLISVADEIELNLKVKMRNVGIGASTSTLVLIELFLFTNLMLSKSSFKLEGTNLVVHFIRQREILDTTKLY